MLYSVTKLYINFVTSEHGYLYLFIQLEMLFLQSWLDTVNTRIVIKIK